MTKILESQLAEITQNNPIILIISQQPMMVDKLGKSKPADKMLAI